MDYSTDFTTHAETITTLFEGAFTTSEGAEEAGLAPDYIRHNPGVPTGAAPVPGVFPLPKDGGLGMTMGRVFAIPRTGSSHRVLAMPRTGSSHRGPTPPSSHRGPTPPHRRRNTGCPQRHHPLPGDLYAAFATAA